MHPYFTEGRNCKPKAKFDAEKRNKSSKNSEFETVKLI